MRLKVRPLQTKVISKSCIPSKLDTFPPSIQAVFDLTDTMLRGTLVLVNHVAVKQEIVEKSFGPTVSCEDIDVKTEELFEEPAVKETKEILQPSHDSICAAKEAQKKSCFYCKYHFCI